MDSKEKEKILVPSDYFFWFLFGVISCLVIFNFWSFKIWQVLMVFLFAIFLPFILGWRYKWLVVSCLSGFTFGFLRILFWGGNDFALNPPSGFLNFLEFIKLKFSASLIRLFPEPVAGFSQGIILGGQGIKFSNEFSIISKYF